MPLESHGRAPWNTSVLRRAAFPWVVLALMLLMSGAAAWYVNWSAVRADDARFEHLVSLGMDRIAERRATSLAHLRAAAGLVAVSGPLSPEDFATFVDRLGTSARAPGIVAIGYAAREGEDRFPVVLIEPRTPENVSAVGFDPFSVADRREAMERARDTGEPAGTSKMELLVTGGAPTRTGFAVFAPVYEGGYDPGSVAARRARLRGFVFTGFNAASLYDGLFRNGTEWLRFQVFAADRPDPGLLLYDSEPGAPFDPRRQLRAVTRFAAEGHPRTVVFMSRPSFHVWAVARSPSAALAGGVLISGLMFAATRAQTRARAAAERSAAEARRSHEALRASEERLRLIVESARDFAIVTLDPRGVVTSWNPGAERIFGYAAGEIVGTDGRVIYTPEDIDAGRPEHEMRRAAAEGRADNDRWHIRKDGSRFWASGLVMPLRDERGGTRGVLKILRDMTPQRRAELALRASEERFRQISESGMIGIAFVEGDGVFTDANDAFLRLVGYSREDVGRGLLLWGSLHAGAARSGFGTGAGPVQPREERWVRKDGSGIWVLITAAALEGEGHRTVVLALDITDRKAAEERMIASEAEFRALFELSAVGQSQTALGTGRFLRVNARLCELTGYSEPELLARGVLDITHPEDIPRERDMMARVAAGGIAEYAFEKRYVRKDGGTVWVHTTRTVIPDASGRPWRTASVVQDITDRRRAEEEIRALNASLEARVQERTRQLEAVNRELDAFASTVAHDLRAPLRGMQGFGQILLRTYGDRLDEKGREYAGRIVAAAGRMDRLIQDLLEYSRLTRVHLSLRPTSLAEAVRDAIAQVEPEMAAARGELRVEGPLPDVRAHRPILTQAVANLLGNAVKFVAPDTEPSVRVYAHQRNGCVRLVVEDNGIGVAPAERRRIFGVFERLHGADSYPGTGIGLAIVKRGVERMGGAVGLEPAPAGGTRFWIDLPSADTESSCAETTSF